MNKELIVNTQVREALVQASQAIETAVTCEEGLDGAEGGRVLRLIQDAAALPEFYPPTQVLDKGHLYLVEAMGGDRGVVQAARVCYRGCGLDRDPSEDVKLIRFLMANKHLTPFEHAVLKFHVKAPVFVARQWFRHRSSSYNEASQRYKPVPDEFYFPNVWRKQDAKDKQGSVASADIDSKLENDRLMETCGTAMENYRDALERGVAKELARLHLPINAYTEFYWTINARNLMEFVRLRSEQHAQWEIRQYSNAIWPIFAREMPWTAEAFLGTIDGSKYLAGPGDIAGPNAGSFVVR